MNRQMIIHRAINLMLQLKAHAERAERALQVYRECEAIRWQQLAQREQAMNGRGGK